MTHLQFSFSAAFQGTGRGEFETHVTLFSSAHPHNFNATAHKIVTKEDKGSRIVHSHRIAFVTDDVAHAVLKLMPNGVSVPIFEVACCTYRLLMRLTSRALDCLSDWLQASFTAWESRAYLEGSIWTRLDTTVHLPVSRSLQGCIAIASFQHAFLGHFLSAPALPLVTADAGSSQIATPPLNILRPTLACL